jgi:hypothetical protein
MTDPAALPYRPAAGVMLINHEGKVFVAQRLDSTLEAWQMPQGGLDEGEDAEAGALRELEEETGISRGQGRDHRALPGGALLRTSPPTLSASSGKAAGADSGRPGSCAVSPGATRISTSTQPTPSSAPGSGPIRTSCRRRSSRSRRSCMKTF